MWCEGVCDVTGGTGLVPGLFSKQPFVFGFDFWGIDLNIPTILPFLATDIMSTELEFCCLSGEDASL